MQGEYVVYDTQTGHINRWVQCLVIDAHTQIREGESFLYSPQASSQTEYVDVVHRVVKQRPFMPVQLIGKELIGVPKGALIYIEDKIYTADGSKIDLDFHYVGQYYIRVEFFPFRDWETTYEAKP